MFILGANLLIIFGLYNSYDKKLGKMILYIAFISYICTQKGVIRHHNKYKILFSI